MFMISNRHILNYMYSSVRIYLRSLRHALLTEPLCFLHNDSTDINESTQNFVVKAVLVIRYCFLITGPATDNSSCSQTHLSSCLQTFLFEDEVDSCLEVQYTFLRKKRRQVHKLSYPVTVLAKTNMHHNRPSQVMWCVVDLEMKAVRRYSCC